MDNICLFCIDALASNLLLPVKKKQKKKIKINDNCKMVHPPPPHRKKNSKSFNAYINERTRGFITYFFKFQIYTLDFA